MKEFDADAAFDSRVSFLSATQTVWVKPTFRYQVIMCRKILKLNKWKRTNLVMLVEVMLLQEPLGGLVKVLILFLKLRQWILNISSPIMTMLDSGKDRLRPNN